MDLVMGRAALERFLNDSFPQVSDAFMVEKVDPESLELRLSVQDQHLRPGGTVSGPSMFALADVAIYLAILSRIGPKALAVTTNASIDFMRKPESGVDLICEARLLKLGRVLAVGDALIYAQGGPAPVARASMTYSIPPQN